MMKVDKNVLEKILRLVHNNYNLSTFLLYKLVDKSFRDICNKIYYEHNTFKYKPTISGLQVFGRDMDIINKVIYVGIEPLLFALPTFPTDICIIGCPGKINLNTPESFYIKKLTIVDTDIYPIDLSLYKKLTYIKFSFPSGKASKDLFTNVNCISLGGGRKIPPIIYDYTMM
jgi:hypothetical protein